MDVSYLVLYWWHPLQAHQSTRIPLSEVGLWIGLTFKQFKFGGERYLYNYLCFLVIGSPSSCCLLLQKATKELLKVSQHGPEWLRKVGV